MTRPGRTIFGIALLIGAWLTPAASAVAAELVLWTTDTAPERLATMEYVANAFMAFHDDATVTIVGVDENQVAAELADARQVPALLNVGSELTLAFAADGLLDERAATEVVDRIGRERFFDAALAMLGAPSAGVYAVPFSGWVQGIWYRRDWFEEAGLAPPADWESLLAAAKRLHDPAAGRYGILVGTEDDAYAAQVFTQIALANGARLVGGSGEPALAAEPMIEALAFYRELSRYMPPGAQTWRGRDFFLQGRLAMMFYSTFIMDDLALDAAAADSLTGDRFKELDGARFDVNLVNKVAMVPTLERREPGTFGSINVIGVSASLDPETRALALEFIEFLFRPDVYITWLHMAPGGKLPVLRDIATGDAFLRDPTGTLQRYGREQIARIIAGFDHIRTFSRTEGRFVPVASQAFAAGIISRMVQRAASGLDSPEGAARAAEAELEELLAEQRSRP